MKKLINRFFTWYNKHLLLNTSIAAFLFALQLVHLYWLATHVIALKALGTSFFNPNPFWQIIIILVDYTEIPALITTTLLYINEYRKTKNYKSLLYIFFLNTQWIHLFWITDEYVVNQFRGQYANALFPNFLAWIAILIDYLELPIIYDTFRKLILGLKKKDLNRVKEALKD